MQGIEVVLEMPFDSGNISTDYVTECLRFYMLEYHVDGFVVNPYNVSVGTADRGSVFERSQADARKMMDSRM